MKIYTKTGDRGETGLFGGERVRKDSPRIEAYGDVDELNAIVGLARSACPEKQIDVLLHDIQNDLFDVGAVLATPDAKKLEGKGRFVGGKEIGRLEAEIDRMENDLEPLKTFVLPGGAEFAARLHLARTVCRRAERRTVAIGQVPPDVLVYLNRLSDFLFVLARWANLREGRPDVAWKKKG